MKEIAAKMKVENVLGKNINAARFLCAAAQSEQVVEPPLKLYSLPGKYATALYTTATKEGTLKKVDDDLKNLDTILKDSEVFRQFLKNPLVDKTEKVKVINEISSQNKYTQTTKRFLDLVADNGRLSQTTKILESFDRLLSAHYGEVTVTVTSAQELAPDEEKHLEESIEMLMKKDKSAAGKKRKLSITKKVDKALLGGLVVEIGDKMIDLSIQSEIADLEKYLKQAI